MKRNIWYHVSCCWAIETTPPIKKVGPTMAVSRVWKFYGTPKMENSPAACCASSILSTSRSRWIFFVLSVDKLKMQFILLVNDQVGGASGGSTHGLKSWEGRGMRHCKVQPGATQVNGPQELREDFCTCSCSPVLAKQMAKMISCARVYWIFHLIHWISHPRLCFIAFKLKSH